MTAMLNKNRSPYVGAWIQAAVAAALEGYDYYSQTAADNASAANVASIAGLSSESLEGMTDFDAMYSAAYDAAEETYAGLYGLALEAAQYSRDTLDDNSRAALEASMRAVGVLNDAAVSEISDALTGLYGDDAVTAIYGGASAAYDSVVNMAKTYVTDVYSQMQDVSSENIAAAQSVVEDWTAGEVPQDEIDTIMRTAAETAYATGNTSVDMFSKAAAQALGLKSLELTEKGMGYAESVTTMMAAQQSQVSAGATLASLPISGGQSLIKLASPYMTSLVDPSSMYGAVYTQLAGGTTISPETMLSEGSSLYGTISSASTDLAVLGQELESSNYWNQQQLEVDYATADAMYG